ncbi:Protein-tyrosine phosphatase-like protein [Naviculisporaceae sp. PSN 640]
MGKRAKKNNQSYKTTNATSSMNSASPLSCILPNELYLAPVSVTGNADLLKREGITHVISIGKNPVTRIDGITYHKLGLLDNEDADLLPVVDKVCEILDAFFPPVPTARENKGPPGQEAEEEDVKELPGPEDGEEMTKAKGTEQENTEEESRDQGKSRVLIHCSAAISRSPAVMAGYLIKSRGMSLRESLEVVVNAREAVSPNVGFLKQLCEVEREVFALKEGEKGTFDIGSLKSGEKLAKILGLRK